jgi:hypothetical protein
MTAAKAFGILAASLALTLSGVTKVLATSDHDPPSHDLSALAIFARTLRGAEMRVGSFASEPNSLQWLDERLQMDPGEYASYVARIKEDEERNRTKHNQQPTPQGR